MRRRIAKWAVFLVLLAAMLSGCSSSGSHAEAGRLPKVLIIGDSISIGYFETTKKLLEGKAEVCHNPGNAQDTRYGLQQLDAWLGDTHWDVIHFNFGLHDLKYVDAKGELVAPKSGTQLVPPDEYGHNLELLVARLKKTHAKLIFATTTAVPAGAMGRIKGDAEVYNRVAVPIMKKNHVRVDDLYAITLPRLDFLQQPDNVHFTPEGYRVMAKEAADSIRAALKRK